MSVASSTISSVIKAEVIPGGQSYASDLTITNTGGIVVSTTATSTPIPALYIPTGVTGATITNFGTITSSTPQINEGGIGIEASSPFVLDNHSVIQGSYIGAFLREGGSFANTGTIGGALGGVLNNVNSATNTGLISGSQYGVVLNGSTLDNAGEIQGGTVGVYVNSNSILDNTGTISAETGVIVAPGGYIINRGLINATAGGNSDAIYTNGAITLALNPGARFVGSVIDTSDQSELILGGKGAGSISLGTQFAGFKEIKFESGTSWILEGNINDLATGQVITGLVSGDTVILDNFNETSYTFASGVGIILSNGTQSETLDIQGSFSSGEIVITDTANGTSITAPCFVAGTRILTKDGEIPVESLKIGNLVRTLSGTWSPIKWIGSRSYDGRFISGQQFVLPILIRRHAIGNNVPSRDLYVSPDHAICEDGMLIPAWRLINGTSIVQLTHVNRISYYHIELHNHDVIFAENCPTESFLNEDCRGRFQNAAHFASLYPGQEQKQIPCLPRLDSGFHLHKIQSRINQRAGIKSRPAPTGPLRGFVDEAGPLLVRGWAQDSSAPEVPILLNIICEDQTIGQVLANKFREDLRTAGLGTGCHAFEFNLPPAFRGRDIQVRRAKTNTDLILPRSTPMNTCTMALCSSACA